MKYSYEKCKKFLENLKYEVSFDGWMKILACDRYGKESAYEYGLLLSGIVEKLNNPK